ncbi:hypothetical protein OFB99_24970, partial [Escherichia coli]|nr:hypothetical protein [Escherichia coli]
FLPIKSIILLIFIHTFISLRFDPGAEVGANVIHKPLVVKTERLQADGYVDGGGGDGDVDGEGTGRTGKWAGEGRLFLEGGGV